MTDGWVPGNRWDLLEGREPFPLPTVSVIVTHFEQHRSLARTLSALARQDYPAQSMQVVVADDGSAEAPDVPAGVVLVGQADEGFRAAAARNLGAGSATGEVLCFLDADTTPEPAYVRRMARLPALLPEAVAVGRRRHADLAGVGLDAPIETAAPAHALPEPAWLADAYRSRRNLLDADDRSYRFILSSVLACTRRIFDEVGGFDESFTTYGGEDWEWAHRAWRDGAVFAHVPDAVAWHDGPDWAGRSGYDAAAKNAEALRLARLIPVAGSRGRAVFTGTADVLVRFDGSHEPAAVFVCVDALLHALPQASIAVTDAAARAHFAGDPRVVAIEATVADPRVICTVTRPFALVDAASETLSLLIRDLGSDERGGLVVRARDGREVLRAQSRRAARRAERWGTDAAFRTDDVSLDDVIALRPQPDVEAWVGGWAGAAQLG